MPDISAIVPRHDVAQAEQLLKLLEAPSTVVYTIGPDGHPHLRTSWDVDADAILAEHENTYYSLAVPQKNLGKKAKKEELVSTRFLHVDLDPIDGLDPAEELNRLLDMVSVHLPAGVPPPSAVIESGRGVQALWKLRESVALPEGTESIERINKWLIDSFNAPPGTHNVDRILRLPGSWTALDKKKRDRGYIPRMAEIVEIFSPERLYTFTDFKVPTAGVREGNRPSTPRPSTHESQFGAPKHVDPDDITDAPVKVHNVARYFETHKLPLRICWLLGKGTPSHDIDEYERDFGSVPQGRNPADRSAWLYDVICNMLRFEIPVGEILGIITDSDWGISGHCIDADDPQYAARRQIARAMNTVERDAPVVTPGTPPTEDPWEQHFASVSAIPFDTKVENKVVKILPTSRNCRVAMAKLRIKLQYDLFADQVLFNGEFIQDYHVDQLWFEVEAKFGFRIGTEVWHKLITNEAREHPFHPVLDYFNSLTWDQKPRLNHWLVRYGGAQDTPFCQAVSALPLIAAVKRIRHPGAKFDEILTLVSAQQGTFKSSAIETLCPRKEWYTDDLPLNAEAQQVIERLQGHLIVECAEVKGMKPGGEEHVKAFLSRGVDKARMAWGRITKCAPRQCVFIATSNNEEFLRDPTGNRRWWPVTISRFDTAALLEDRDQLWAEAVAREAAGESIRLAPDLYEVAAEQQALRTVEDPYVDALAASINSMWGTVLADTLWSFLPNGARGHNESTRARIAMERLGWKKSKVRVNGIPQSCFVKGGPNGEPSYTGSRIIAIEQKGGKALAAYADQTNGKAF